MKSKLKIVNIQTSLFWESALKNRAYFDKLLNSLNKEIDIVLLPEMFTSGFTMNAKKVFETMGGPTGLWMQSWAEKLDGIIGGSVVIKEKNKFFNRFLIVSEKGVIFFYDKRHTFSLAGENKIYTSGNNPGLFEYHGWKICLRICYDLRFPVWSRNQNNYDLLIFVANWPSKRIKAWDTLLQARAIENMCYVSGVNRIGYDDNELEYPGHSAIYNPLGNLVSGKLSSIEKIVTRELNYFELMDLRNQLPFLEDKDNFDLY